MNCASCMFSVKTKGQLYCHRYPPQVVGVTVTTRIGGEFSEYIQACTEFPEVEPDIYCWEFKDKQPEPAEEQPAPFLRGQ